MLFLNFRLGLLLVFVCLASACEPWNGTALTSGTIFQIFSTDVNTYLTYGQEVPPNGGAEAWLTFIWRATPTNWTYNAVTPFNLPGDTRQGVQGKLYDSDGNWYGNLYTDQPMNGVKRGAGWNFGVLPAGAPSVTLYVNPIQQPADPSLVGISYNSYNIPVATTQYQYHSFQLLVCSWGTPLTLTVPTTTITVVASSASGAQVFYNTSAFDYDADAPTTVQCTLPSGSVFPIAWTVVNCQAVGMHGSYIIKSFSVWVTTIQGSLSGAILQASSQYNEFSTAERGRLGYVDPIPRTPSLDRVSAWCPGVPTGYQWLQFSFTQPRTFISVATQGRYDAPTTPEYVTTFQVQYTNDGVTWTNADNNRVFSGSTDQNSHVYNTFYTPFTAFAVRFVPKTYVGFPCLRAEVYTTASTGPETINSYYAQLPATVSSVMSASTVYNEFSSAEHGRLNYSDPVVTTPGVDRVSSWCAAQADTNQWLQFSFAYPVAVVGVNVQGRPDYPEWVTSYYLQYTTDGTTWVKADSNRLFVGSSDQNGVNYRALNDIPVVWAVRFNPQTWLNYPCMRAEIHWDMPAPGTFPPPALLPASLCGASISASTNYNEWTTYERARLNYVDPIAITAAEERIASWCAGAADTNQWVQFAFATPRSVSKVAVQGRPDYPQWVTSFFLQYTPDGVTWINADNNRTFVGSSDSTTATTSLLHAAVTAYAFRINPLTWNGYPCLRAELY